MGTVKDRRIRIEWNFDSRTHTHNPDMSEGKNMSRTLMQSGDSGITTSMLCT